MCNYYVIVMLLVQFVGYYIHICDHIFDNRRSIHHSHASDLLRLFFTSGFLEMCVPATGNTLAPCNATDQLKHKTRDIQ